MHRIALLMLASLLSAQPKLELISTKRIWNESPHSAFGDIIRFHDRWWCVFREGKWHVARPGQEDDGKLRVLTSKDGETWKSAALIAEQGIDLRDPHLSITADGRLMIVAGGSEYPKGAYQGRQPRVVFSKDGSNWTAPQAVLEKGHWLWRVTWHIRTRIRSLEIRLAWQRASGKPKTRGSSNKCRRNPLGTNYRTEGVGSRRNHATISS